MDALLRLFQFQYSIPFENRDVKVVLKVAVNWKAFSSFMVDTRRLVGSIIVSQIVYVYYKLTLSTKGKL